MALSRFALSGTLNTGTTYIIYMILLGFMPYVWAYSVTYVAGLTLGYVLNAYWVFKVKPAAKSAAIYPLAYVLNYLVGLILLRILVEYLGVPREIAPLIVVAMTLPVMFLLMKFLFHGKLCEKAINQ